MIRRIGLAGIWAFGTFALAMALGLPTTSNAVDDFNSRGRVIQILTPRLTVNGVVLSATPQTASTTQPSQTAADSASQPLEIDVRAENRTAAPASGNFTVLLYSTMPSNPAARTMRMPTEFWKDSGDFTLAAGETKTLTFTSPPLSPNRIFTVYLDSSKDRVTMASTVTAKP